MAEEIEETRRFHPLAWVGWILAALFLAAAAGLAHHGSVVRQQQVAEEGTAAQLRLQLDHANQLVDLMTSPQASHIVLTETRQPPHPVGQVSWLAGKGALVFVAGGLRPLPENKTYELWLIPANGKAPVPAGTFRPDADRGATVVMPPLPADTQAKSFLVTIEPLQGSETPSLPIVIQSQ